MQNSAVLPAAVTHELRITVS